MGLISQKLKKAVDAVKETSAYSAALQSFHSVLDDQWKEYFRCDSMDEDVLVTKGVKHISGKSSNTNGSSNIITNGSIIAVADGQCMLIVENGKIADICAEPGAYVYDTSTEPSIFSGNLGESVIESFKTMGKRFTFGGDTGNDQRIYYVNTKFIMDNKFGTPSPIPFKIYDEDTGFALTINIKCNGVYTYRITDPVAFYTNVCGNVVNEFRRSEIDAQLKADFVQGLTPAFSSLSEKKIAIEAIASHSNELIDALNEVLKARWTEKGITVKDVSISPISLSDEDKEKLNKAQTTKFYSDAGNAAGMMAMSQAAALEAAANNSAGAMTGFLGMGMAMNTGGLNASQLFEQAAAQKKAAGAQEAKNTDAAGWKCSCGATATGNFCPECGAKKPNADGWTCPTCGNVNKGKFCGNCGAKKPAGVPLYKCDKCGWEPEDPANPPKFCPECGDPFDDKDIK
ncbi:MAG: SPFH domain-containing protein [Lachnospiraceae bacterium]|nr:SPFH domain-containing protein [Lachnospiraceae bacterium]